MEHNISTPASCFADSLIRINDDCSCLRNIDKFHLQLNAFELVLASV